MKKRLFHILTGRNSGSIAKKRLEFLLIADRAGCTPEILEMLKNDMIKVISRYMMIDPEQLEVKVIHMDQRKAGEKLPVLYASVPVRELLVLPWLVISPARVSMLPSSRDRLSRVAC